MMSPARSRWPAGEYEGPLLGRLRHGNGIMKFKNGNVYRGEFMNDMFEGMGEYIWADGRSFVGKFRADKIEGKGIAHWPDGRKYEGEWIDDLAEGHGILKLGDSRVFEGTFKRDFPVRGQMIELDGTTFLASFDGRTHASEWYPCKKSRVGTFQNGWNAGGEKAHLIREFLWDDGRRFAGNCVGYCPSAGVVLDINRELLFVVFRGRHTFAEGPKVLLKRKLFWQVRADQHLDMFAFQRERMITLLKPLPLN